MLKIIAPILVQQGCIATGWLTTSYDKLRKNLVCLVYFFKELFFENLATKIILICEDYVWKKIKESIKFTIWEVTDFSYRNDSILCLCLI